VALRGSPPSFVLAEQGAGGARGMHETFRWGHCGALNLPFLASLSFYPSQAAAAAAALGARLTETSSWRG